MEKPDILDQPEEIDGGPVSGKRNMKAETVCFVLFLIGISFKFMHWPGAGIMIVLSLGTLSVLYFPLAFYIYSIGNIKRQNLGLSIVSGFFFSVCVIGLLFKIQHWPDSELYLTVGVVAATVIIVIVFYLHKKAIPNLSGYYSNMLKRSVALFLFTLLFYLPYGNKLLGRHV